MDKNITPAILTAITSSAATIGDPKKYLHITFAQVRKTIKNKTIAAKLEIKRLTQRASRSIIFINKIILNYLN